VIGSQTWTFDGQVWTRSADVTANDQLKTGSLLFDPNRGKHGSMLLFGGSNALSPLRDIWSFDGIVWTLLNPMNPIKMPVGLFDAAVVYDSTRKRIVLFGGKTDITGRESNLITFEFDGTRFTEIASALPFDANDVSAAFDPISNRVIALTQDMQTWELEREIGGDALGTWTPRRPAVSPASITVPSMQFDTVRRRMIMVGNKPAAPPLISQLETWTYAFGSESSPPDTCEAQVDSDRDGLTACGDGLDPSDPTRGADPDCYGRCFPQCALPTAGTSSACDPALPHCGDGVCNPFLENAALCPRDCP
jgi:hypothetical protein